jgi:flagellar protein FliT
MATATADIISRYEAFVDLSGQVLTAARQADWDLVLDLDRKRNSLLSEIKAADAGVPPNPEHQIQKKRLVEQYLTLEAETRSLVEAWMADLRSAMHSNSQEQRLLKHYGAMANIGPPSWPE